MFTTTGLLVLIAAVIGSSAMVAVLAWMWFRLRRLEGAGPDADRLLGEIEQLREELEATRAETRKIAEQVDFVERLLESGEED